jgi:phosphoenolpyruvate carboxykinase (ATP)
MEAIGSKLVNSSLVGLGITGGKAHWNLSPEELADHAIRLGQAKIASSGALAVDTGEFTGRSPKDKFTVKDALTQDTVHWNNFNIPFDPDRFDKLYEQMARYFSGKEFYVRDA